MDDLISVIVPIYNVEPYLRKCVDSIIHQTYRNLEIVLVDDGSPDNCGKICDEYAKQDNRIVVIHKTNGGLSDARNAGMENMHGRYVGFVDSDDWIEPDMYEVLLSNLKWFDADMSFGGVSEDIEVDGNVTVTKISQNNKQNFAESNVDAMKRYFIGSWAAWDKLYKAELFSEVRYPFGEINEDEAIVLNLLEQCSTVCYTSKVLYHYIRRMNSGSITMSGWNRKKLAWCDHCERNLRLIEAMHPELEGYAAGRYCASVIWALNNMAENPKNYPDLIPQYRKKLKQIVGKYRDDINISRKEKLRTNALMYLFGLYSATIRLLGKHYS